MIQTWIGASNIGRSENPFGGIFAIGLCLRRSKISCFLFTFSFQLLLLLKQVFPTSLFQREAYIKPSTKRGERESKRYWFDQGWDIRRPRTDHDSHFHAEYVHNFRVIGPVWYSWILVSFLGQLFTTTPDATVSATVQCTWMHMHRTAPDPVILELWLRVVYVDFFFFLAMISGVNGVSVDKCTWNFRRYS